MTSRLSLAGSVLTVLAQLNRLRRRRGLRIRAERSTCEAEPRAGAKARLRRRQDPFEEEKRLGTDFSKKMATTSSAFFGRAEDLTNRPKSSNL